MGMDFWVTGWIKLGCKQRIILARNICNPCLHLQRIILVRGIRGSAAWHLVTALESAFASLRLLSLIGGSIQAAGSVYNQVYVAYSVYVMSSHIPVASRGNVLLSKLPGIKTLGCTVAGLELIHHGRHVC